MIKNITLIFILIFSMLILAIKFNVYSKLILSSECLVLTDVKFLNTASLEYEFAKSIIIKKDLINLIDKNHTYQNENCPVLNLKNKYLIPSLIDSHTHLLSADRQKVNSWKEALLLSAEKPLMTRLFLGEKNSASMLQAGFTTVRDLGNSGVFLDAQLTAKLKNYYNPTPDIIYSGPGISYKTSQIGPSPKGEYTLVSENINFDLLFKSYKKHNSTWIKIYVDNSGEHTLMPLVLLNQLVDEAHSRGFKVALHAENAPSATLALQTRADSIEHFYQAPLLTSDLILTTEKPYIVVTPLSKQSCINLNFNSDCNTKLQEAKESLQWLKNNAFTWVFGSDALLDFSSQFSSRGEASLDALINLIELDLMPSEILQASTYHAAQMLNIKSGLIAENYKANFLILNDDPTQNLVALKNKSGLIFNGQIVCGSLKECQL